jgi:hypothetical protein
MSTAPSKVVPGTLWLDSRPLHGRGQGESGERLPQARLMCTLGGSLREKQKIREEEEEEEEEKGGGGRKNKKKRRRQSRKSEAI